MQKASVPISKSQRLRKNCGHKKSPENGAFWRAMLDSNQRPHA